jgi:hypothetical protein
MRTARRADSERQHDRRSAIMDIAPTISPFVQPHTRSARYFSPITR